MDHLDWLVGDKVIEYQVDLGTHQTGALNWQFVLKHEGEVRVRAIKAVNEENKTIAEGLRIARADQQHRVEHFISPMSIGAKWAAPTAPSPFAVASAAVSPAAPASVGASPAFPPTPSDPLAALCKRLISCSRCSGKVPAA